MKTCTKCGGSGPFQKKAGSDKLRSHCNACMATRVRAWRKNNPDKAKRTDRNARKKKKEKDPEGFRLLVNQRTAKYRARHPEKVLHTIAKHRAMRKGIPFNLDVSDIVIPEVCPLLGIELTRNPGKLRPNSPTLDRKDPALGYVKGNVWVISHKANTMKQDVSPAELELFACNVLTFRQEGVL